MELVLDTLSEHLSSKSGPAAFSSVPLQLSRTGVKTDTPILERMFAKGMFETVPVGTVLGGGRLGLAILFLTVSCVDIGTGTA